MALSVNEANTVSSKYYDKTLVQQVYQKSPFYVRLKQKNRVTKDGGTQITWPIRYSELSRANAVGPREAHSFGQKETRTQAVQDWKYYLVDAMIQWDERVKNTGKPQVVKLIADKTEELKEDMDKRFATDLYTTNPNGKGITALPVIVDSADTYAGIAVADAAAWAAIEDSSTTTLNLYGSGSLSYAINQATFGTDGPDFHLTTRDLFSKFESLLESQKRYTDKKMADAGFTNLTFHGNPVIGDAFCTAAYWYGLDMDHLEICYHPEYNLELTPWKELFESGLVNALARTMSWAGNIKCDMRKCHFKFSALDYTL